MTDTATTLAQLRPHLSPNQQRVIQQADHLGKWLAGVLTAHERQAHGLDEFDNGVDADVRSCLERLDMHRDLLRWCDQHDEEVAVELRIGSGEGVTSRRVVAFLEHDRRSEISYHAALLRGRIESCTDWLSVAARRRGVLGAGEQFDERRERQLRFATQVPTPPHSPPPPSDTDSPCPPGGTNASLVVAVRPKWDTETRTLTFGRWTFPYPRSAPAQEQLLTRFQAAGWPERVSGDLPDHLSETVRNLNNTISRDGDAPIRFERDGTGGGVRWRQHGSSAEVS